MPELWMKGQSFKRDISCYRVMLNGISRSVICLLYDRWSFRTRRSLSEKIWATSLITPRCSVPLHQPSELSCCIENRDIWAQPALTDFQHPLIKGWLLKHRQPNGSLCKPTYAEDKARADKKGRKKENKKQERNQDRHRGKKEVLRWGYAICLERPNDDDEKPVRCHRSDPGHERGPWVLLPMVHSNLEPQPSPAAVLLWDRVNMGAIIRLRRIRRYSGKAGWVVPVSLVLKNWALIQ